MRPALPPASHARQLQTTRGYQSVPDLPRTATGKKMHYKIRDAARDTASITAFDRP